MVEVIPQWIYWGGAFFMAVMTSLIGLVALHYRSVQNGRLFPKTTVELIEKLSSDRIAELIVERDGWKQVSTVQNDTLRIQAAQIDELTSDLTRLLTSAGQGPTP